MPKTKSAKQRKRKKRLNLRTLPREERFNASMKKSTGVLLEAAGLEAGSQSINEEILRLLNRDAELTRLLKTQEG